MAKSKAKTQPFDFDDLSADKEDIAPPKMEGANAPPVIEVSAVERAHEEGLTIGEQRALDSLAAAEAEMLRSVASLLSANSYNYEEAINAEKIALRECAGVFLESFCAGIMAEREVELAETLLSQLLASSDSRERATLFLNPDSVKRHAKRLDNLLNERDVSDFFAFKEDQALEPGECRIEWRGGAIRRTKDDIKSAIDDVFSSALGDAPARAKKSNSKKEAQG